MFTARQQTVCEIMSLMSKDTDEDIGEGWSCALMNVCYMLSYCDGVNRMYDVMMKESIWACVLLLGTFGLVYRFAARVWKCRLRAP